MNEALKHNLEKRIERTMKALQANRMEAYYVSTAQEVLPFVQNMLPKGAVVACGGSASLDETGVMQLLESGNYEFLDRRKVSGPELDALYGRIFTADWYLASSNAVTEQGELYNVDGNSNRVAAMTFGPKNVLLVVGCNKIVADLEAARQRVEQIAAPANAHRLHCQTPCATTGVCGHCHSPQRICCNTVIQGFQRHEGRIKVLLVGEPLGF